MFADLPFVTTFDNLRSRWQSLRECYGSGDVFEFNGSTGACVSDFIPEGTGGLDGPTFVLFGEPSGGTTVPEPSSLALAAFGLTALAAIRTRRKEQ